jgi:hypothetical protein
VSVRLSLIVLSAGVVSAGKLWRYRGAATVSQPEIAGEICSIPSFPGTVRVDRSDVDAEALSEGFGWDCDVYGSGSISGDCGGGWADRELRIFLPFTLTLAPLTVELAMQHFLPEEVTMRG